MDLFKEFNFPLTIGIIGNKFGTDPAIFDYVYNNLVYLPTWELEIACHGFNHEDFSTMTLAQQQVAINGSISLIRSKLPITPIKTFIPPFNSFNTDTVTITKQLGFTHFSAQIETDFTLPYLMTGTKTCFLL
jgi:peptidoglycan/xylan/chitin deacetylase (PgdA/CDA1 family)